MSKRRIVIGRPQGLLRLMALAISESVAMDVFDPRAL
jgi:hypothetical protein